MPAEISTEQRAEAVRILGLSLSPLPRAEIVRELLKLKVKTNSRNMDAASLELQFEVYADELSRFPADCALQALREAGRHKWWPDWGELERLITPLEATRRRILHSFKARNRLVARQNQSDLRGGKGPKTIAIILQEIPR